MNLKSLVNMINTTTPYAWDDSLGVYEFLGKIVSKLNEVVDLVNLKIPDDFDDRYADLLRTYTEDELMNLLENGLLETFFTEFTEAIEAIGAEFQTDFDTLTGQFSDLQTQFNAVIANATVDSEVMLARGSEPTLGARLDGTDARLAVIEKNDGSVYADIKNDILNGNFVSSSGWTGVYANISVASNRMTVTGTGAGKSCLLIKVQTKSIAKGQRIYFRTFVRVTNNSCIGITTSIVGGYLSRTIKNPEINKWYLIENLSNSPEAFTGNILSVSHDYVDAETANGKVMEIERVMYIDLSQDFGLGANPQLIDVQRIYELNSIDFWDGTQKLIYKNMINKLDEDIAEARLEANFKTVHHEKRRPVVSFVNDDGWEDDYIKLRGFSETYEIPFTSALIANGSTLKQDQVLYLQNTLGWEIASHTANNVVLPTLSTEAEIENELKTSKEILESRGYKVYNLVYPQGESDERVRRIAKKYFNCAATTLAGINTGVCPSFYLKRFPMGSFISGTYEIYKEQVDLAVAQNGWLIFMLHPNNAEHDAQQQIYIEQTIQYIQSLNVDILTLNDGYKIFGNALEVGDYIGGEEGLAISKTGERKNI